MNGHEKYEFSDLAESKEFESFVRMFMDLTGIPVGIRHPIRPENKLFYTSAEMNPICKYIRSTVQGHRACQMCDQRYYNRVTKDKKDGVRYLCHAGLIDFAIPIYVENQHIAYLGCGQIMYEVPNETGYKRLVARLKKLSLDEEKLRAAYFESHYMPPYKIDAALKMLTFIAEYFSEIGRMERNPAQLLKHPEITEAKKYVRKNYQEPISLKEVADHVFLSENYFGRLFSKVTGRSFSSYLQHIRIEQAKKLLETTDRPITQIGLFVGFGSLQYFNEVFRKWENCCPREYRKKISRSFPIKNNDKNRTA